MEKKIQILQTGRSGSYERSKNNALAEQRTSGMHGRNRTVEQSDAGVGINGRNKTDNRKFSTYPD